MTKFVDATLFETAKSVAVKVISALWNDVLLLEYASAANPSVISMRIRTSPVWVSCGDDVEEVAEGAVVIMECSHGVSVTVHLMRDCYLGDPWVVRKVNARFLTMWDCRGDQRTISQQEWSGRALDELLYEL